MSVCLQGFHRGDAPHFVLHGRSAWRTRNASVTSRQAEILAEIARCRRAARAPRPRACDVPSQTQSEPVAVAGAENLSLSEGGRQDSKTGQALLNGWAGPCRNESVVLRGLSARH